MQTVFVLVVAVSVISAAVGLVAVRGARGRERRRLADAAATLGLHLVEGSAALEQTALDAEADGRTGVHPAAALPPVLTRVLERLVSPRITGTYRGVRVSVHTETHSSSSGSHKETAFRAYLAKPLPFDLHMTREGVGAKIAKAFGGQDVEIGEPAFDAAVRIRTTDPDAARSWFSSPTRRQATVAAVAACPGLRVTRACVIFERQGSVRGAEEIASVLDAIAPLAAAMGDSSPRAPD